MRIEQLYLFPVKSCAGVSVESFTCSPEGPLSDREWMVVNSENRFVTQRELPRLALVKTQLEKNALRLSHSPASSIEIPFRAEHHQPIAVEVWGQTVAAQHEGNLAARWLSDFLGQELRLVRIAPNARKKELGEMNQRQLRFVDDYPLHVASLASLDDLNKKLSAPLEVMRFRPNIVVSGSEAWAEDHWRSLRIGGSEFLVGRACTRCTITTVDPATGERGAEPLKTLAGFRKNAKNKIEFGIYLHSVPGAEVAVGMEIEAKA